MDGINPVMLFVPTLVLVAWTLLVLLVVAYRRFKAAFAGKVSAGDFRYGESATTPAWVSVPNRVFMNLLEVPLLFYVLMMMVYMVGWGDSVFVALAWGYVLLRVVHSLIYLTYNHVLHRFWVFALSNVLLAVIWGRLVLRMMQ